MPIPQLRRKHEQNWEMSLVIAKEPKNNVDNQPVVRRVRGQRARACACGQQLDVCTRTHCPRCGRTLRA